MLTLTIFLAFAAFCHGNVLHVKHAPQYVVFQQQGNEAPIKSSSLPNILSGPLGVKNQNPVISSKSVLKRPAANVLFTLITQVGHDVPMTSLTKFPLELDMPYVDSEQLMNNVQRKFIDREPLMFDLMSDNQLFDIKSSSPLFNSLPSSLSMVKDRLQNADSIMNMVPQVSLNSSLNSDSGLLAELQMARDVVSTLKVNRGKLDSKTPDLLSFTLTGMKAVADEHGLESDQVKEAEKIVNKHIDEMTNELKSIYNGNVMVEVVISPSEGHGLVRKTRSLKSLTPEDVKYHLAVDWYEDFPMTFNIILWLMVILVVTVIMVAYGIWNMNPNLESILYRVPQDELKKLN